MAFDTFLSFFTNGNKAVKIYTETEILPLRSVSYPIFFIAAVLTFMYIIGPWWEQYLYGEDGEPSDKLKSHIALGYEVLTHINFLSAVVSTGVMYMYSYSPWCQPINPSKELSVTILMWIFFFAKVIECLEMVLWVLNNEFHRRASNFLAYHHVTSIIISWLATKIAPGGTAFVLATINSWAHVFMYTYFTLRTLDVEVRAFRPFLLIGVMLQLFLSLIICLVTIQKNCGFPYLISIGMVYYMISIIIGFLLENSWHIYTAYFQGE